MKPLTIAFVALGLMIAGPAVAYVGLAPPVIGFGIFVLSALAGLIAVAWGLVARLRRGHGLVAALLGLVPVAAVVVPAAMSMSAGAPRINDITTDLADPPALTRDGVPKPYPQGFVDEVKRGYPDLVPSRVPAPPAEVMAAARALVEARGWALQAAGEGTLHAVAETGIFRFQDDVVVRVRADGAGSVVDVRSASRVGQGDLGANAARIRAFLADLKQRLD